MPSTEKFLDILAERDLLPEKLLAGLRRQVAKSSKPIRAEALAKRLIDAGHLTPALAKRLLAALPESEAGAAGDGVKEHVGEDNLGFAPLEDDLAKRPSAPTTKRPAQPPSNRPGKPPGPSGQPRPKPSSASSKSDRPEPPPPSRSLLDEELAPFDSAGGSFGPLDGLLAGDGMDATASGSPLMPLPSRRRGLFGWLKRRRHVAAPRHRENVWESPALLLSGGVLLGLLILGAVLLWALGRQSGDDVLAAANEEYRAGSYTQAIHKFDQYLQRFPRHQGASGARVKRGLALMRQKTAEGGDWSTALTTAQQVIKEIAPEEAFGEAAGELAAMLPAIAQGLASRAQETNDPELLAQAREAVDLAGNRMIVPTRLQPTAKLDEIEAQLGLVDRQIRQAAELDAAVAAIETALAEGAPALAYEARHELLRSYPALVDDSKLIAATRAISAAQKSAVQVTEEATRAVLGTPATSVLATQTLAERATKEPVDGAEDEVFVMVAAGAAYGFRVADGRLLWSRYLGELADGLRAPAAPVPAASTPGSDVFVLAPTFEEVWRLDARTGRPRWRLPLGEPADISPILAGGQLVVATRGGRLHLIDADSGSSVRHIQLPQSIAVAPAVDTRRGLIYQAADHSNLFILDLAGGSCRNVVHLGHAEGSLSAAPALVGDVLLVPVNDRARTAVLQVYGTADADGLDAPPSSSPDDAGRQGRFGLLQEFRVRGQFDRSPVVAGRNVVALTDLGATYLFELSAAEPENPLVPLLRRETTDTEPLVRYCLLYAGQLFLADHCLTKFNVQAAEGRLQPQWISDERSAFLEPPHAIGNAVVHVRRRVGEPGVIVAAVHADDGRPLWQNRIAVPPADRPIVPPGGQQVIAVSSTGSLFSMELDAIREHTVLDEPAVETEPFRRPISTVIDLGDGAAMLSAGAGSNRLALFNPAEQPGRYVERTLPGQLTCPPVPLGKGVLLPCLPGHLFFLDPRTNRMLAEPFQPLLAPNGRLDWRVPAIGIGGHVALADGRYALYAITIEPEPKPHWKAIATVELSRPIIAPLAAAGNMVFAVDEASAVTAYELPQLQRRNEWLLEEPCAWGPVSFGQQVLLTTETGELICFDAAAKLRWRVAMPNSPLAGATALDDGHFLLATAGGTLWRIDAGDGRELARVELNRSLDTAPVPAGPDVLIGGRSGSLYRVRIPKADLSQPLRQRGHMARLLHTPAVNMKPRHSHPRRQVSQ